MRTLSQILRTLWRSDSVQFRFDLLYESFFVTLSFPFSSLQSELEHCAMSPRVGERERGKRECGVEWRQHKLCKYTSF